MIPTSGPAPQPATLRGRFLRWVRGPTLARDVVAVVALKVALLIALKFAFFDHPTAGNMSMPPAEVAHVILSVPAPAVRHAPNTR
jgi:hypothetical protein